MSVLIVDDEQQILETLRRYFELEGIEVACAKSAEEALELQKSRLFPVILTDIRLGSVTGSDLTREVKKMTPTCIVFVMTGYSSLSSMTDAFAYGAVDYFTKPFDSIEFVVKEVKSALDRHQRWKRELAVARTKRQSA